CHTSSIALAMGSVSEFAVRVQRSADSASDAALANTLPGGLLTPRLLLPTGQVINLTPLQLE
ncbi:hypothetical protein, partial [Stenotrophomonas maltophilia]|uniref:hypothetical protein n=1 Tax=Stenotrophomonas maltophilia TaxID=40324 RepID=UPI001952D0DD